jgi:hypothetical protein
MVEAVTTVLRRLLLWLTLLAFPFSGSAHRLDEYLQATLVTIEPGDIKLQINLTPGVVVATPVLALIDRDRDGVISTNEAAAYAELLKRELALQLDRRPLELKLTASEFPPPDELRTGFEIIQLEYAAAPGSLARGAHELVFENRHQTNLSVYLVNAALPKSSAIQITRQTRNENQSTGRIEFTFQPPPADWSSAKRIVLPLVVSFVVLCVGAVIWRRTRDSATSHGLNNR